MKYFVNLFFVFGGGADPSWVIFASKAERSKSRSSARLPPRVLTVQIARTEFPNATPIGGFVGRRRTTSVPALAAASPWTLGRDAAVLRIHAVC
jgi:hypothetical protein